MLGSKIIFLKNWFVLVRFLVSIKQILILVNDEQSKYSLMRGRITLC